MNSFVVRHLRPGEVSLARQLLAVFHLAFEQTASNPICDEQLRHFLARDDFHAVVTLENGEVTGGLTAYELPMFGSLKRELLLYNFAVAPQHRRRGIGRALIEFARGLCETRELSALCVPAHASDEAAVGFYGATGLLREEVAWFTQEFD